MFSLDCIIFEGRGPFSNSHQQTGVRGGERKKPNEIGLGCRQRCVSVGWFAWILSWIRRIIVHLCAQFRLMVDLLSFLPRWVGCSFQVQRKFFSLMDPLRIDHLHSIFPSWFSHLGIQCTSAVLGGITTTALINPLDIVRARVQV